jgi:DNA repair protein RadC
MKPSKALTSLITPRQRKRLPESLADIARLTIDEMLARGIPIGDARRISAAIALAKEIAEPQSKYRTIRITSPATAMQYCLAEFRALACQAVQEEFWMVSLDTKNQPIASHQITVGTLRNSLVHPREVFRPAISDAVSPLLSPVRSARGSVGYFPNHLTGDKNEH